MHAARAAGLMLLLVSVASSAAATVMVRATVEQLTAESERVVLGAVVAATPHDGGPRGEPGIYTRVEVAVEETWRGAPSGAAVFWVHGGRLGARAMRTHGQATFAAGERVVVFLDDAGGALFPTGMSQGKWLVEGGLARSEADPGSLVVREGSAMSPAAPLPAMDLATLRARVRSVR